MTFSSFTFSMFLCALSSHCSNDLLLQSQEDLTDIEALLRFIQFIPLEDEILDFFRPVAAQIMQQLRAKPCLPTQGTNTLHWFST